MHSIKATQRTLSTKSVEQTYKITQTFRTHPRYNKSMNDNTGITEVEPATKQAGEIRRNSNGTFAAGQSGNVSGRGGFGDNPENRASGSWRKEDTVRYKLEQMMVLTGIELSGLVEDDNTPLFERKLAQAMIDGSWPVLKDMMNEVYGRPKESIEVNTDDNYPPIIRGFVIPTLPEDFLEGIDNDIREQLGEEEAARILNAKQQ